MLFARDCPTSLCTRSLSPPSWYSKISVSDLRPEHLRKVPISIESISILKYAATTGSCRLAVPGMAPPPDRSWVGHKRGAAYHGSGCLAIGHPGGPRRTAKAVPGSGRARGRFLGDVGALARPLVDAHDDELRRAHGRDPDFADEMPRVARVGRIRLVVAFHVERLLLRGPK